MVTLISDGGTMTVGRRTANFTWGSFDVVLPSDTEQQETDSRIVDGYIYRPDDRGRGRGEATFVRADARIDMNSEKSDLEDTLDGASKRTEGSVFYSREISGLGLGKKIPGADYSIGDVVNVLVWGKRIALPVTAVKRLSNTSRGSYDAVQVGGQALADPDRQRKLNSALDRQIAAEKRQRLKDIGAVDQKASDALAAASIAVKSVMFEYAVGQSEVIAPSSGWSTSAPVRVTGTFLWQRSIITYGSGTVATSAPVLVTGNTGASGSDGLPGKDGTDGVGITSTIIDYALGSSGTTAPSVGWSGQVPALVKGQYLWTRTTWTYTDSTSEKAHSVSYLGVDGSNGTDGLPGKDGTGITSTAISYAKSASGSTVPTTGWQSTVPATVAGDYVWTRTTWTYSDSTSESGYSVGRIGLTGAQGAPGATGSTGVSVTLITPYFRQQDKTLAAPAKPTVASPAGWVTTEPEYVSGKALYRAEKTTYSNSTFTWSDVTKVSAYDVSTSALAKIDSINAALTGSVNGDMAAALNNSATAIGAVKEAATTAKQWTVDNQEDFNLATSLALSAQQQVNDVNAIQWINQTTWNEETGKILDLHEDRFTEQGTLNTVVNTFMNEQTGWNATQEALNNNYQAAMDDNTLMVGELRQQVLDLRQKLENMQSNQYDVFTLGPNAALSWFRTTTAYDGDVTVTVGGTFTGKIVATVVYPFYEKFTQTGQSQHSYTWDLGFTRSWTIDAPSSASSKAPVYIRIEWKRGAAQVIQNNTTVKDRDIDEDAWVTLHSLTIPKAAECIASIRTGWHAATNNDSYGVRIRAGNTNVAIDGPRSGVGPRTPFENGYRIQSVSNNSFNVAANTTVYLEVYSTGDTPTQRRVRDATLNIAWIDRG